MLQVCSQIDAVEDAAETDSLAQHLDDMFAPGAPHLPWDGSGDYVRGRLELYYLSYAAAPLGLHALTEVCCPGLHAPLMAAIGS